MKRYELLIFNKDFLKKLFFAGIKVEHYKYADLFNDYKTLLYKGEKKTYIVAYLAEKYFMSERKVYSLINQLNEDMEY